MIGAENNRFPNVARKNKKKNRKQAFRFEYELTLASQLNDGKTLRLKKKATR